MKTELNDADENVQGIKSLGDRGQPTHTKRIDWDSFEAYSIVMLRSPWTVEYQTES